MINKAYKEGDKVWIILRDTPQEVEVTKNLGIDNKGIYHYHLKAEGNINFSANSTHVYPTKIALLLSFLTEEEKIKLKESL